MGSGTTIIVATRMERNSIGIDVVPEYYEMVKNQLKVSKQNLLETGTNYENDKPERRIAIR